TRKEWPECRSFSGAVQKYLGAAVKLHRQQQARIAGQAEARRRVEQVRQEQASQQQSEQHLQQAWAALSAVQQEELVHAVRGRVGPGVPAAFVQRLCLEELARPAGGAGLDRPTD